MNAVFDYKFGNFIIPRTFVLYSSKHFFAMVPPNQLLKGRKITYLLINKFNYRYFIMLKKRCRKI